MAATVFFQGSAEIATLQNTFMITGTPTDPSTISCVITDPNGTQVTHTYQGAAPNDITKNGTGVYQLTVPCNSAGITSVGLWSYVWVGTGAASDIQAGTWTVQPINLGQFYCSVEEVKDRLHITDTQDDMTLQGAVQSATKFVERYCGRHFYQVAEARTYVPYSIYEVYIDDLVAETQVAMDYDGFGIYSSIWVKGTDYELSQFGRNYNLSASGEAIPFGIMRAINYAGGGKYFPFIWPFSKLDRIQITGTWGWQQVPFAVRQATLQVAADLYKLKDAPFGVAGTAEFGQMRVTAASSPVLEILRPYVSPKRGVGV